MDLLPVRDRRARAPGPAPGPRAALIGAGTAALVAVPLALSLTSLAGTDTAAQRAHADFWAAHPGVPLDLRWFAGASSWGYSVLTPPLVAAIGPRAAGVLCAVAAAALLGHLLARAGVRRPACGALVGGIAMCGNLPSGRTAFALGTALGLGALAATGPGAARRLAGAALAVAAVLASPVAGLFVAVAGAAWAIAALLDGSSSSGRARPPEVRGWGRSRGWGRGRERGWRVGAGVAAAAGAALLGVQLVYRDAGPMPFLWTVAWPPLVATGAVALAGRRHRALVVGAALYAAGVLVTYAFPGSLGSSVERLALLFAAPLLAATATVPLAAVLATAVAVHWQSGVPLHDLRTAGAELPEAAYAPLLDALPADLPGRVEVVPLRNHGESAVVAREQLLARGWARHIDQADAGVLYTGPLDPGVYRRWLDERAVHYVALADAPLDWSAGPEAALLAQPPAYLEPVAVGGRWRLWRVRDPAPLVAAPAVLHSADAVSIGFDVPALASVVLRLRWSPLLRVSAGDACLEPGPRSVDSATRWTLVRVRTPGDVRVTSGPLPHPGGSC